MHVMRILSTSYVMHGLVGGVLAVPVMFLTLFAAQVIPGKQGRNGRQRDLERNCGAVKLCQERAAKPLTAAKFLQESDSAALGCLEGAMCLSEVTQMDFNRWLSYFQHNRANRLAIPWERDLCPETDLRAPLIASLQRFQIGETGEGRRLMKGAHATGDETYVEAMRLFIAEEHEHVRLLAEILARLGAPLIQSHWSDDAFIALRHFAGLRMELMTLLVAEMIAKRYYRALCAGTQDVTLRAIFAQIVCDENDHVAFHCDALKRGWADWPVWVRVLLR